MNTDNTNNKNKNKVNVSITRKLLCKTYGNNCPERLWPKILDDSGDDGFCIVGCDSEYDVENASLGFKPAKHMWCKWGWDIGTPIRFDSFVDAEIFVKTLHCQDEKGRSYTKGLLPIVEEFNKFVDLVVSE